MDTLVSDLQAHLAEVSITGKELDKQLLRKFDRQVTESITEPVRDTLIQQLAEVLPNLEQDPAPVTNLIELLVSPNTYTFTRVLEIKPVVDFEAGLSTPSSPINLVTLSLLSKAQDSKGDVGIVASRPPVVAALIKLWLSTPDTAVASSAHRLLVNLLTADLQGQGSPSEIYTQSLLWRRVFRDKDAYGSIYRICSLSTAGQEGQLSKRDKTVAQARLLDLVVKIDCHFIRESQIPEVENHYGVKEGGLLDFATSRMVEYEDDVLMHMTLIDFFAELLKPDHSLVKTTRALSDPSYALHTLQFLEQRGLHSRTISYFMEPAKHNSSDLTHLYGRSANYVANYASFYPSHFLNSPCVLLKTLARLGEVFHAMSSGRWAQGKTPKHDLHVLASLPRLALLPGRTFISPIFFLPTKPANEDVLQTLATIFHGPASQQSSDTLISSNDDALEHSAARALYYLYLEDNPDMWHNVVKTADTIALKKEALAAIALIKAVITADWSALPSAPDPANPTLPTESKLAEKCQSPQGLPLTGILAICAEPTLSTVVPYLLRPAQTFSNLVGGGKGDVESAAFRVARNKYDAILALKSRLEEVAQETEELKPMVTAIEKRLASGIMGGNDAVGSAVGTLEL
ncbi:MAG: hypothetical protein Q9174_003380 [Haloplaca sp. 1 TL-2023]